MITFQKPADDPFARELHRDAEAAVNMGFTGVFGTLAQRISNIAITGTVDVGHCLMEAPLLRHLRNRFHKNPKTPS